MTARSFVTIACYRSGFANVDDKFVVVEPSFFDPDDLSEIRDYCLPVGYEVADSRYGDLLVYNRLGEPCDVCVHRSGLPQLVSLSDGCPVLARKVEREGCNA